MDDPGINLPGSSIVPPPIGHALFGRSRVRPASHDAGRFLARITAIAIRIDLAGPILTTGFGPSDTVMAGDSNGFGP